MSAEEKLLFEETTSLIIGAFYAVYNELGYGFLESVYQHAMFVELGKRGLKSQREVLLPVIYSGVNVGDYRADLIVQNKIIVETKTASCIHPTHRLQLFNYLKASGLRVGLVVNFGPKASFQRHVLSRNMIRNEVSD